VLAAQAIGEIIQAADALSTSNVSFEQMRRDSLEYVDFYPRFKQENDKLFNRQIDYWRAHFDKGTRHELIYEGHQTLVPRGGGLFDVRKVRDHHRIYQINRLQPYSDEQTAMWMAINPKIRISLLTDDQETIQRKLDAFNNLSDHFDYLHITPEFIQCIAKHAQFWAAYHCEVWFDTDGEKGREYKKRYKTLSEPPRQMGLCLQCDTVSEHPMDAAPPVCPGCGSPYLELTPLQGYDGVEVPAGEGWEKAGEVEMAFDPSFAVRYSLTRGPELSPWLYHERDEVREVVECEYDYKLPGSVTDNAWARDEIMHPGRLLRRAERDRGVGSQFESDDECVLVQRFYYEPEMLHFIALNRPETLPNGEVIPARVRLSEIFPKGLCIKTVPGLAWFLDGYRESHKDRFIHGKYNVSPGKAMPRGNDEAPNFQKYLNVLMSGAFDHVLKTLAPSTAIVEEVYPDGRLFNRDDRTIRVKLSQLLAMRELGGLDGASKSLAPPPLNQAAANLIQGFSGDLRRATKSETYLNAEDEGIDPDTATAVRVGENRNARGSSLQLSNFTDFLKRGRYRAIKLGQENYGEMRQISRYDEEERNRIAVVVRKTDIAVEFQLWVERNSWMPDLELEVRAAWKEGLQALTLGLEAGLPKEPLIRSINRAYNIDLASDKQLKRIRSCEETLDLLRENLPTVSDAWSLYQIAPVNPYELNQEAMKIWWQEWLSSPKGKAAHPLLRQVAMFYIQIHAAAWLGERQFLEMAAQIGQGLIAAPILAGISADQQQAPKVMAPPVAPGAAPAKAGESGDGATVGGSDYQNGLFDSSNLAM
jgi:hypothetical protein